MVYATLDHWNKQGRYVIKGSTPMARTTSGEFLFRKDQTKKYRPRKELSRLFNRNTRSSGYDHTDECDYEEDVYDRFWDYC